MPADSYLGPADPSPGERERLSQRRRRVARGATGVAVVLLVAAWWTLRAEPVGARGALAAWAESFRARAVDLARRLHAAPGGEASRHADATAPAPAVRRHDARLAHGPTLAEPSPGLDAAGTGVPAVETPEPTSVAVRRAAPGTDDSAVSAPSAPAPAPAPAAPGDVPAAPGGGLAVDLPTELDDRVDDVLADLAPDDFEGALDAGAALPGGASVDVRGAVEVDAGAADAGAGATVDARLAAADVGASLGLGAPGGAATDLGTRVAAGDTRAGLGTQAGAGAAGADLQLTVGGTPIGAALDAGDARVELETSTGGLVPLAGGTVDAVGDGVDAVPVELPVDLRLR